jgi:hypothetical protein
MKNPAFRQWAFFAAAVLALVAGVLLCGGADAQQVPPSERVYHHPQVEIEKALEAMQAYATQRLPTLDGFANANATTLDNLENPHYQLHIELVPQGNSQTVVRVSAKITAWSQGPDPARSQYTVVPSNGRVEEDFLDRLSLMLEKGAAGAGAEPGSVSPPGPRDPSAASPGDSAGHSSAPAPSEPTAVTGAHASAASLASQIDKVRSERAALEQDQRKLERHVAELEAASQAQVFLQNVAIVKMSDTPVFESDDAISKILFRAEPDDEFEILEFKPGWVKVRVEGGGEGWLRASQLERRTDVSDPDEAAAGNFTAAGEQIKPFEGDWPRLKGKMVLFVFAQPARAISDSALGQNQLSYAKHMFLEGYREATHSDQQMAGVVVVFLGAKGGVAAATLEDIRRWHEGYVNDNVFLERCSLDPPASFRDAPGH